MRDMIECTQKEQLVHDAFADLKSFFAKKSNQIPKNDTIYMS